MSLTAPPLKAKFITPSGNLQPIWRDYFDSVYDITGKSKGTLQFSVDTVKSINDQGNINFVAASGVYLQGAQFPLTLAANNFLLVPTSSTQLSFKSPALFNTDFSTGDLKLTYVDTAPEGWIFANDGTIGNSASTASNRANDDTETLFKLIWANFTNALAPVLPGGRGGSAQADFDAAKTINLPLMLGRAIAGAGAGTGLTSRTLGDTTGTETHTLSEAELPAHTHDFDIYGGLSGSPSESYAYQTGDANLGAPGNVPTTTSNNPDEEDPDVPIGAAHNNMQPTTYANVIIKL